MAKEIIIPHKEISDPQKITQVMIKKFKEIDLDIHVNEVESLEDCHKTKTRILKIKNTKYFNMPQAPWLKDKK